MFLIPVLFAQPAWAILDKVKRALSTDGQDSSRAQKLTKTGFPIHESGHWTCLRGRGPCVYWLDNDRVIFNGSRPNDLETTPDGRQVSRHAIYIWDLKGGNVTKYADAERAFLCYADGYIRYERKEPPYTIHIAGTLGKEVEIARTNDKEPSRSEMAWTNRFTCRTYRQSEISPLPGAKVPLDEGHGFIYLGKSTLGPERMDPVVYYPEGDQKGIELPIARWQVTSSNITSTEFDNSYILTGKQRSNSSDRCVPKGFSQRVYRLRLSGTLETISLPPRDALRCIEVGGVREVRIGLSVYVNNGLIHQSGLYLVDQSRVEKLVSGWVPDAQVSPNGCRLAAGISSEGDPLKPTAPSYRGHL
ncbi:MAG TPA: hypothetical protein VJQ25_06760, partial [Nitrospira sp.]|nr:hypothetical protein [Nitrospira sp.]